MAGFWAGSGWRWLRYVHIHLYCNHNGCVVIVFEPFDIMRLLWRC